MNGTAAARAAADGFQRDGTGLRRQAPWRATGGRLLRARRRIGRAGPQSRRPLALIGGFALLGALALAVGFGPGFGVQKPGPIAAAPTPTADTPTDDPGGGGMASCIMYDPALLPTFEIVFDGTITAIEGDQVTFAAVATRSRTTPPRRPRGRRHSPIDPIHSSDSCHWPALKRTLDPDSVFRLNHNIEPAAGPEPSMNCGEMHGEGRVDLSTRDLRQPIARLHECEIAAWSPDPVRGNLRHLK